MQKLEKKTPFVRYEKLIDFSKESDTFEIKSFYMIPQEIISCRNIPLYVNMAEDVTIIYYLSTSATDYVRDKLAYNLNSLKIEIHEEFICKFDLVRVIPEGGYKLIDSFLRVMLKQHPENSKPYSIEEEFNLKRN